MRTVTLSGQDFIVNPHKAIVHETFGVAEEEKN